MNDLREHKRTNCSEALIQRLLEEDSEQAGDLGPSDPSNCTDDEVETSEPEEEWVQQGRNKNKNKKKFQCQICGLARNTKMQIEQHMRSHDKEEEDSEFTCDQCAYQTINRDQFIEHMDKAHSQTELTCIPCKTKFRTKHAMKKHKKETHKISYKPCRNFPQNNCEYDNECNFSHIILNQGQHICYKCGDILESKTYLLKHITSVHGEEICKRFLDNKCSYGERCFFKHIARPAQIVENNLQAPQYRPQVFYNLPVPGQQNLQTGEQGQQIYRMMNTMMTQMMKSLNLTGQQ